MRIRDLPKNKAVKNSRMLGRADISKTQIWMGHYLFDSRSTQSKQMRKRGEVGREGDSPEVGQRSFGVGKFGMMIQETLRGRWKMIQEDEGVTVVQVGLGWIGRSACSGVQHCPSFYRRDLV